MNRTYYYDLKGSISVYSIVLIESGDDSDGRLESIFGVSDRNITFKEFLSTVKKLGIEESKFRELLHSTVDGFVQAWCKELKVAFNSCVTAELTDFEINGVRVNSSFIEVDITSNYEYDVNDCADSNEWEDCAKFINKCADKLARNAYESSVYNNYIFSLEDCEVDVEFADTPSEPDYDDDDYVSVRYVPLNI